MKFVMDYKVGSCAGGGSVHAKTRARVRCPRKHGKLVNGSDQQRRRRCVDRLINYRERKPRRGGECTLRIFTSENETAPSSGIAFEVVAKGSDFPSIFTR